MASCVLSKYLLLRPQVIPPNPSWFLAIPSQTSSRVQQVHAVVTPSFSSTGLTQPWSDQARSRQQVVQMLQRIELNDKVALYVLDRGLRVVTDFGVDKATLLEKLAALRGDPRDLLEVPAPPIADASVSAPLTVPLGSPSATGQAAGDFDKEEQVFFLDRRVHDTLLAFEEIANHLATVPGRKILIWVSAGFPLTIDSSLPDNAAPGERAYSAEIRRAIQKLNDADVAVYPIDARGLTASPDAIHHDLDYDGVRRANRRACLVRPQ